MQITAETAVEYVKAHFAKSVEQQDVLICGTAECGEVEPGEAIDVFFLLPSETANDKPYRFTVWIERYPNVAPFIYGEW